MNVQHYSPIDYAFVPHNSQPTRYSSHSVEPSILYQRKSYANKHPVKVLDDVEEDEELQDISSLDNVISTLEASIKEKEAMIKEIWKSVKIEKEELNFLKKKQDELFEHEIEQQTFYTPQILEDQSSIPTTHNQLNGFEDRLVIEINIKVSGYLTYTLDAQLDTGAMNSCAKYGAIPSYFWQPIYIAFKAINKTEIKIQSFAPDFPILLKGVRVPVNLCCFDTEANVLLGQDFVNKCLPFTVGESFVHFTVLGKSISISSKSSYESRIRSTKPIPQIERSIEKLAKIQKIVSNAEKHGLQSIRDIKEKIEIDCTSDYPDVFWTREKYFVDLPYKEDYSAKPQKASANHMSPTKAEYCQKEIVELLQKKLIESSRIPWACPCILCK